MLKLTLGCATLCLMTACNSQPPRGARAQESEVVVGGRKAVTLTRPATPQGQAPEFVRVDMLPGRGMNVVQIQGFLPGRGIVDLMEAPSLNDAAKLMNGGTGDEYGNQSFRFGGGLLLPFANRIRGDLATDQKSLQTNINGQPLTLDANFKGKLPTAIPHAMHGLMLGRSMDDVQLSTTEDTARAIGTLNAGNFNGHWPSQTKVTVQGELSKTGFILTVTATNTGQQPLPMGIGWHPYFRIPSGQRAQARLHIPATSRTVVNNYDDVFPTGAIVPVAGTPYDFNAPNGAPLNQQFLDDCFLDVQRGSDGQLTASIIDPAAKYGLRIRSLSPEITAFQVYAPPDKTFVVFEPQFNLADPYSPVWQGRPTGMVTLQPGQSVTYKVALEPFIP